MSLKYEQYRALLKTKDLLLDIIDPTKKLTPLEIKERAHSALRHFPALMETGEPIFSRDDFKSPYQNKP